MTNLSAAPRRDMPKVPSRRLRTIGVAIIALLVLVGAISTYIAWSASRGLADVVSHLPDMLVAADSLASRRLPDGSAVVFQGRKIATLRSARMLGRVQPLGAGITIYTGTWEPTALSLPLRSDSSLAAEVEPRGEFAPGVIIRLVPRAQHRGHPPRGAVWLDPAPGVYVLF